LVRELQECPSSADIKSIDMGIFSENSFGDFTSKKFKELL